MGNRATIKEAIAITGLSEYTLRQGIKQGRLPYIKLGISAKRSKILIDIELLEQCLQKEAMNSMKPTELQVVYGKLRSVVE